MLKDLRLLACHLNDNSSERPRRIRGSRSSWGARSEEDRMLDAGGFPRRRTAAQRLWLTKHQDPREADERCTGAQSSHNRSRPSGCFWSDACLYPHRLGVSARGDQNAGHRDLAHLDSTWPPQPNSIGVAARSSKEWQSTGAWSAVYRPNVHDYEVFSQGLVRARNRRKPLATTSKLAPMSANTAIHIEACPNTASTRNTALMPSAR